MAKIDITKSVRIWPYWVKCGYKPFNGTYRVSMYYQGHVIGMLKSTGWDMLKGFSLEWHTHPTTVTDDSWFSIFEETIDGRNS